MELDDALEQAYLLPTIPAVVHELLGSFDRSDIDVDAISSRVALDPVIAGKVLRMANSAQFCRGRRIGSIHDAVMVLGFNRLRTLVIASGAAMMSPNLPGFDHVAFWRHNLQTACLARAIGTLVETRPEECFVAGLMHGIGQLLLRSIEPELYRTIDAVVATGEPRRQAEQAVLGLDHATLGGALAREWGLPASIGGAIEHYGAPLEHLPDDRLAAILSLAETLASALVAGSCAVESLSALPLDLSGAIGLDHDELASRMESLCEESTAWFALLGT
ncbi:MAG: HDOD domain-containing protein [Rhodocyclaceae bacterium]|nr:HDOD domain-containing protein [Rhodocyclaceae bacterium]MCB1912997.1 HDOD domain-containing protein [Rhodocyclaceae bacterium]MCP5238808.1 HDOD domain-containing protein [Zoogloeaceae bacterium]MCP5254305.1 HDOD domain-containing protein [Zoogloeaceae bacterium]MCW5614161.1 HDOD domain-containing protein [Rhodocyclaceae bacterium]